jgi:uncharacterized protein (DUF58 family)
MLRGRAKRQDDLVFGVVQIIGILVVFYVACSRGREILAGVAFLVFSLILLVLAGGLILFLVRRALERTPPSLSRREPQPGTQKVKVSPPNQIIQKNRAQVSEETRSRSRPAQVFVNPVGAS